MRARRQPTPILQAQTMLLLDRQPGATTQPRGTASRVQLRLRADGQCFELPPGKTTIGSSPRCNVRIQQPGVQPLHCLIADGPDGLRVRSWAGNTALNGVPFEESALSLGDCLSLGPVELDVIDPQAGTPPAKAVAAPVADTKETEQFRAGELARSRSRQLLETLRHERTAHEELRQQVAKLQESHLDAIAEQNSMSDKLQRVLAEQNGASGRLESTHAELAAARRQLVEYQSLDVARQELAERNEQLGFEVGELSAQINELTRGQVEAANERQKIVDDHAALHEERRQLVGENSRLQNDTGRLANEKAAVEELNRQLAEHKSQLQSEVGRLVDAKNAVGEQQGQLAEANARLQDEVGRLANEKVAADEHNRQLIEQKSQLQSEVSQLRYEKSSVSEQHGQLTEANSRLHDEVSRLANEKAAADEQNRQLIEQKSQLHREIGQLTDEKNALSEQHGQLTEANSRLQRELSQLTNHAAELDGEREGLRRQYERLEAENRSLVSERGTISDERTALCQERSELRQQNEELRDRVIQLNEENSAMAVGKLTLVEQRDALGQQAEQLQASVAALNEENAALAAAKTTLADELARLVAEQKRLSDVERKMTGAVADRESTSAELYRALLQLAEVQERDEQNKEVIAAYESLSNEHSQLIHETSELKEQMHRLGEERAAVEGAWQELSGEAATLNESQQRLSEENSTLLANLDETRQQLEKTQQDYTALAGLAAELERERAAKLQAEADAAAAIAEGERRLAEQEQQFAEREQQFAEQGRQFAEQSRQFTETIQTIKQQLAAASDMRTSLERTREEAQLHLAEAESRRVEQSRRILELETQLTAAEDLAAELKEQALRQAETDRDNKASVSAAVSLEQARRIEELEAQLAAAEELAAKLKEQASAPPVAGWANAAAEPIRQATTHARSGLDLADALGDVASPLMNEQPTEFNWSAARAEAQTGNPSVHDWDQSDTSEDRTAEAVKFAETANPWGGSISGQTPADGGAFGEDEASVEPQPEQTLWPTKPEVSLPNESADVAASIAESSADELANEPQALAISDPFSAKPQESLERPTAPEQTSFIERFSHLLTDDVGTTEEKPNPLGELANSMPAVADVVKPEAVATSSSKVEEEDSIEEYMAKLLQRVRGDSPGGPASQAQPSSMPLNAPAAKNQARTAGASAPLTMASPRLATEGQGFAADSQPTEDSEPLKRKFAAPTPQTDLGALRALANETARQAISRHELRKHRRSAVTKVIVCTLAGVTSLWLMLDSPDWYSIQFITACMALLVAAYWAGETFRTLVGSLRAATYDGPEAGLDVPEAIEPTALPIDVEDRS